MSQRPQSTPTPPPPPSASPTATIPTRHHSNRFWSEGPTAIAASGRRLAVLLLNARHDAWDLHHDDGDAAPTTTSPRGLFARLWEAAEVTMCADGGANRLYDRAMTSTTTATGSVSPTGPERIRPPQYIKGDLDSLRADVRAFYAARGTTVVHDPDQNSNDLDKCLQLLRELQDQPPTAAATAVPAAASSTKFTVLIFGAMGGRFDQEIQNLNALFRWDGAFEEMALISESTTARLLRPGARHVLEPNWAFETRTCGLVPLHGPCEATWTTGLKWDLDGTLPMGFGQLISTSNHVVEQGRPDGRDLVTVECTQPLVWTTEMRQE